MNIYVVIIGTEILNARREDKHFAFVQKTLAKYGYEIFASFVIKDDKKLIEQVYRLVRADEKSLLFSFGGIGSTPDDLTRALASKVFRDAPLVRHRQFFYDIIKKFGDEAYPHRVHMADLPPNSDLLKNPINNMSGFSLENRFFFMPGFVQMSHPMVEDIAEKYLAKKEKRFRFTLLAQTSENTLITLMQNTPDCIELSSLPILSKEKKEVELSLSGDDKAEVEVEFNNYIEFLKQNKIEYKILKTK